MCFQRAKIQTLQTLSCTNGMLQMWSKKRCFIWQKFIMRETLVCRDIYTCLSLTFSNWIKQILPHEDQVFWHSLVIHCSLSRWVIISHNLLVVNRGGKFRRKWGSQKQYFWTAGRNLQILRDIMGKGWTHIVLGFNRKLDFHKHFHIPLW